MKIIKNHRMFKSFNNKVIEDLQKHEILNMLVGQELYDTADLIIQNYFEYQFEKELKEEHFKLIADSVELNFEESIRLEQDGKIYYKTIARYVLKELMYQKLIEYINIRQTKILQTAS